MKQSRHPQELIRFHQVGLSYKKDVPICFNIDFTFFAGGFYFLTGPSGVGKTSLLKLIYKDLEPTQGFIQVLGRDLARLSTAELPYFRQKLGLIFQDCRLLSHISALDNVALPMKIAGSDIKKARVYAKELLHWVGLGAHLEDFPQTLSDGQKQRVAIARAVITRPKLLLADEPTGNVDNPSAFKMMSLFEELNKVGTTIILATHNRDIVTTFPYPEIQLYHGQLTYSHHEHPPAGQYI
ncbi:MAG: ATP-binding cassette domain-containing protein [Alphaproteobacteria bacterium]|nr:ATP-binding cassette domain-containing protein [Alphaproteobacteria bacterium]